MDLLAKSGALFPASFSGTEAGKKITGGTANTLV